MSWTKTVLGMNLVMDLNEQKNLNHERSKTISDQQDEIAKLKKQVDSAPKPGISSSEARRLLEGEQAKKELAELREALKGPDYKQKLAKLSPEFRERCIEEQKVVTEWLWEQKAFQEIVMVYGGNLNKPKEEILADFESAKQAVYAGTATHTDGLTEENKKALGGLDAARAEAEVKEKAEREQSLIKYLEKMERLKMQPTPELIAKYPQDVVEKVMGKDWKNQTNRP